MINIKKLYAYIPETNKCLINNLNIQIKQGEFVILLGSNGSGKSSLLSLINQTSSLKYKGKIMINGSKIQQKTINLLVATVTQSISENLFLNLTILENFLIYYNILGSSYSKSNIYSNLENLSNSKDICNLYDSTNTGFSLNSKDKQNKSQFSDVSLFSNKFMSHDQLIKNFKEYLYQFNRRLPKILHDRVNHLSGGEKQALALALALSFPRKVLLLDEHTSALDPKASQEIMDITNFKVKNLGITCIMTVHNLDYALAYGDRIIVLKNGEIFKEFDINTKKSLKKEDLLNIFTFTY